MPPWIQGAPGSARNPSPPSQFDSPPGRNPLAVLLVVDRHDSSGPPSLRQERVEAVERAHVQNGSAPQVIGQRRDAIAVITRNARRVHRALVEREGVEPQRDTDPAQPAAASGPAPIGSRSATSRSACVGGADPLVTALGFDADRRERALLRPGRPVLLVDYSRRRDCPIRDRASNTRYIGRRRAGSTGAALCYINPKHQSNWEPTVAVDPNHPEPRLPADHGHQRTTPARETAPARASCSGDPPTAARRTAPRPSCAGSPARRSDGSSTRRSGWRTTRTPACGCGTIYVAFLDQFDPGVQLFTSHDGGDTWSAPVTMNGGLRYMDKPILVISPSGRDVYVAFNDKFDNMVVASHDFGAHIPAAAEGERRPPVVVRERRSDRAERRRVLRPERRDEPVRPRARLRRAGGGGAAAVLAVGDDVLRQPDAHLVRCRRAAAARARFPAAIRTTSRRPARSRSTRPGHMVVRLHVLPRSPTGRSRCTCGRRTTACTGAPACSSTTAATATCPQIDAGPSRRRRPPGLAGRPDGPVQHVVRAEHRRRRELGFAGPAVEPRIWALRTRARTGYTFTDGDYFGHRGRARPASRT